MDKNSIELHKPWDNTMQQDIFFYGVYYSSAKTSLAHKFGYSDLEQYPQVDFH